MPLSLVAACSCKSGGCICLQKSPSTGCMSLQTGTLLSLCYFLAVGPISVCGFQRCNAHPRSVNSGDGRRVENVLPDDTHLGDGEVLKFRALGLVKLPYLMPRARGPVRQRVLFRGEHGAEVAVLPLFCGKGHPGRAVLSRLDARAARGECDGSTKRGAVVSQGGADIPDRHQAACDAHVRAEVQGIILGDPSRSLHGVNERVT